MDPPYEPDPDMNDFEEDAEVPGAKSFAASSGRDLTSKFRGVCWNRKNKKWQAAINSGGKYLYLGSYDTQAEAGVIFDKAAVRIRGEKSKLNFRYADYVDTSGNVLPDPQVEALLLEASNPTKVRRQTKKRARDGGQEEDERDPNPDLPFIPTSLDQRGGGRWVGMTGGAAALSGLRGGAAAPPGPVTGPNASGGAGTSMLNNPTMSSLAALLATTPSELWSQQVMNALTQNPSLFAAAPQQQQQQQQQHDRIQWDSHTHNRPSAGALNGGGGRGDGAPAKKGRGAGRQAQQDKAQGPLSSPPPTTDPNAADIALKALARMVKGQGQAQTQGQAQGQGAQEVPNVPVSPASLLSSLLSKAVPTTKAFQMAASAGLMGGVGGSRGGVGGGGAGGGGINPVLNAAPFHVAQADRRQGQAIAASTSLARDVRPPHEDQHNINKRGIMASLGAGGGVGGGAAHSRPVTATLGDLSHVVVIHEDPEDLGVAEEGQGVGSAHVAEEGGDEVGRPLMRGNEEVGGGPDRLSSLKAVQDLSKIDVLAALAMFSMPTNKVSRP